jgi:hypothetical protein
MLIVGEEVFADPLAIVGERACVIAKTQTVFAELSACAADATPPTMSRIRLGVDARTTTRSLSRRTVAYALPVGAKLFILTAVVTSAAMVSIGRAVATSTVTIIGQQAAALALSVDAGLSARTYGATSAAMLGIRLGISTSSKTRLEPRRAVVFTASRQTKFSKRAFVATSAAVFVVCGEVFTYAIAIVGEGIGTTAFAIHTGFSIFAAVVTPPAVTHIRFEIYTACTTGSLSAWAVGGASSIGAKRTRRTWIVALTAVIVVGVGIDTDAIAFVGEWVIATTHALTADLAARTSGIAGSAMVIVVGGIDALVLATGIGGIAEKSGDALAFTTERIHLTRASTSAAMRLGGSDVNAIPFASDGGGRADALFVCADLSIGAGATFNTFLRRNCAAYTKAREQKEKKEDTHEALAISGKGQRGNPNQELWQRGYLIRDISLFARAVFRSFARSLSKGM